MMPRTLPLSDGGHAVGLEAGRGEPIVLVHGVGMRAEAWGPQIDALSTTHRVIAVNMPGHGDSSLLSPGAGLADYVGWLADVITRLDCGPVNLAGHSMGALIAAGLAIERPDLVSRLAVLNGVHRRMPEAKTAVLARAAEIAQGMTDNEAPLNRWFGDSAADQAVRAQVAGWLRLVDGAGYAAAYRVFAESDAVYADRWAEITCPALVLTGAGDLNSTAAMTRNMAAAARNGIAVVIEGHRHMVNLTAPDVVTKAMCDWLSRPAANTTCKQGVAP